MVIEQSQILTTHNLATLVQPVGVAPAPGWPELARRSFRAVWQLVSRVRNNPRPLGTIKDAAYAWRQTLLYLALTTHDDEAAFVAWAREQVRAQPASTTERLAPVVAGLEHVLAGGTFDADGVAGDARRFLGWAVGGHAHLVHVDEGVQGPQVHAGKRAAHGGKPSPSRFATRRPGGLSRAKARLGLACLFSTGRMARRRDHVAVADFLPSDL
jgi:hypothetical protein